MIKGKRSVSSCLVLNRRPAGGVQPRMKRLLPIAVALPVLILVAVLVVLAGCSSASDEPVAFPSDRVELVASYLVRGGMMPAALSAIEAPVLMVYSDGTVVSRAQRVLTLGSRDLTGLVRDLRHDLSGLAGSVT